MTRTAHNMPERLAESALRLFSKRGIDKVKLDDVAAEIGVTKGSLYWHYKSKHELIKAACGQYYKNYQRRIHAEAALETDPVKRMNRILRLTTRICILDKDNRVFTTEIWALAVHDEEIRDGWRQFYESVREFFIGLVSAAQRSGLIAVSDPEESVNLILEAMEGVKLRAVFEPQICSPEEESRIMEGVHRILGYKTSAREAA